MNAIMCEDPIIIKPCFGVYKFCWVRLTKKHFNGKPQVNTCTLQWVRHVLKNIIELHPIQKTSSVVVLFKILRLSLKPRRLESFKTTYIQCIKIEYGPNSGNAKSLWALTNYHLAPFCKKVMENVYICSVNCKNQMLSLTTMEHKKACLQKCSVARQ